MRENTFNGENLSPVAEDGRATAYQTNALNQYTAITEEGAAPFHPTYDANGNQTLIQTDTGIWAVDYDFFNQPIKFTQGDTLITCGYDYMGRRWFRKVTQGGTVTLHERYLYRGYQQIAMLDLLQPQPTVKHVILWDPSEPTATRPLALLAGGQLYLYGLDFSKNVTELMNSATGTLAAAYDYAPFGAVTSSGGMAAANPLQWSSEVHDPATGLVYYNYRHLNTRDGRWISRDLIAENGGLNLYEFVKNNPCSWSDTLGGSPYSGTPPVYNPQLWNDEATGGRFQFANNCYSYACDRREDGNKTGPNLPQPGDESGFPPLNDPSQLNCAEIIKRVKGDGLKEPDSKGCCSKGYHKVQLVISPGNDFHWYRQDRDGKWSHKRGWGPVQRLDASGNLITNPVTANRDYSGTGGYNYNQNCGTLCSPDF
ncbi:RHS repeat-associated core domain-containing protein [Akkermansia muciniphila]|nr:RHS repeat-associated core domain-containing protein [Akkermansia muciniphila]